MPDPVRALPLSDREAQSLFRALLTYEQQLSYSMILDTGVVQGELDRVRGLQERISLTSFHPDDQEGATYDAL